MGDEDYEFTQSALSIEELISNVLISQTKNDSKKEGE